MRTSLYIRNTHDMAGMCIKNAQKKSIGKVEAVILNTFKGEASFIVVSLKDKHQTSNLFTLPWDTLAYDKRHDCFIISIDEQRLNQAPSFHKHHWPDFSNPAFIEAIHNYFGTNPHARHHS